MSRIMVFISEVSSPRRSLTSTISRVSASRLRIVQVDLGLHRILPQTVPAQHRAEKHDRRRPRSQCPPNRRRMRTAPDPIELSPETRFMAAVQRLPSSNNPRLFRTKSYSLSITLQFFQKFTFRTRVLRPDRRSFQTRYFGDLGIIVAFEQTQGENQAATVGQLVQSGFYPRPRRPLHRRNRPAARSTRIRPGFCLRQATGRIRTAPTETTPASVAGANGRSLPGRKFSPARPRSGAPSEDMERIRANFKNASHRLFGLHGIPTIRRAVWNNRRE